MSLLTKTIQRSNWMLLSFWGKDRPAKAARIIHSQFSISRHMLLFGAKFLKPVQCLCSFVMYSLP